MKILLTLGICSGLLFTACAHQAKIAVLPSTAFTSEELAVAEAVFRHLFDHNYSGLQKKAKTYCLSVHRDGSWQDMDRTFLARFADMAKPVREGSRFRPAIDLRFSVTAIEKKENGLYRVTAGYYEGLVSGSTTVFDVRLEVGRWSVTKNPDAVELISKRATSRGSDWAFPDFTDRLCAVVGNQSPSANM